MTKVKVNVGYSNDLILEIGMYIEIDLNGEEAVGLIVKTGDKSNPIYVIDVETGERLYKDDSLKNLAVSLASNGFYYRVIKNIEIKEV